MPRRKRWQSSLGEQLVEELVFWMRQTFDELRAIRRIMELHTGVNPDAN